ncbi:MAG TPA: replicative DNA helicase, partial [Caldithrix abyssi]|nr:replicative DNA helicase [Caldithrix abyssi]
MLLDKDAVSLAMETVDATYFYKKSHQAIFAAMMELYANKVEIDLITLTDQLKKMGAFEEVGGALYLAEVSNSIPSSANVEEHLNIVKEKALKRLLIKDCDTIINRSYDESEHVDELLDFAERKIFEISEKRLKVGFKKIDPILHQTFERIDELYRSNRSGVTGVATGFAKLDELTAGLQPSDLVILAGRPSMGKTAFALNIARNAAVDYGYPVGIFSLEMSSDALVMRLLCSEAKVNQMAVRTGKLTRDEMQRLTKHVAGLMNAPIYIDDSPSMNVLELRAKARRLKTQHNIQLLIIDYLQLMEGHKGENRQQE